MSADDLTNQAKIVENNVTVARFLQSIDTDGNASNGIQITDKVLKALTDALKNNDIKKAVPKDTSGLEVVVDQIKQQDPTFKGDVKTTAEAEKHLQTTQSNVLTDLVAGKTFYHVYINDNQGQIIKTVVNQDVTQVGIFTYVNDTLQSQSNMSVAVDGNKITYAYGYSIYKGQTSEYLTYELHNNGNVSQERDYFDEAKAKEYLKSLTETGNGGTSGQDLKSLLAGNTFYIPQINDDGKAKNSKVCL